MRNIESIDLFTKAGYERLYNIQMGDIWGGFILDSIAPISRGTNDNNSSLNTLDERKYAGKSSFLQTFYKGGKNPNYWNYTS